MRSSMKTYELGSILISLSKTSELAAKIVNSLDSGTFQILALASDLDVANQDLTDIEQLTQIIQKLSDKLYQTEQQLADTLTTLDNVINATQDLDEEYVNTYKRNTKQYLEQERFSLEQLTDLYSAKRLAQYPQQLRYVICCCLADYTVSKGKSVPVLWEQLISTNGSI
jgi:uncharacterized phage infection (PIP) family protein YhgE